MAAPVLLRQVLLMHRVRFHNLKRFAAAGALPPPHRPWCSAAPNPQSDQADEKLNSVVSSSSSTSVRTDKELSGYRQWEDGPDYRKWKDREEEILRDIQPIVLLTKDILHSGSRYMDGERLTVEDERAVVEKLLSYHPHSEDKIGCGLESIMVDRHPQFRHSRCLFVVRTDGGWIDFSYQKCLREYIRDKYPNHAERFIREHFKRGSD